MSSFDGFWDIFYGLRNIVSGTYKEDRQYEYDVDKINLQNKLDRENYELAYQRNLPVTQMANLLAAGINPNLASGISTGTVSQPLQQSVAGRKATDYGANARANAALFKDLYMELGYKRKAMQEQIVGAELENESKRIDNKIKKATFTDAIIEKMAHVFGLDQDNKYKSAKLRNSQLDIEEMAQWMLTEGLDSLNLWRYGNDGIRFLTEAGSGMGRKFAEDYMASRALGYNAESFKREIENKKVAAMQQNANTNAGRLSETKEHNKRTYELAQQREDFFESMKTIETGNKVVDTFLSFLFKIANMIFE